VLAEVAGTVRYGEKNVYVTGHELWNGYGLSFGDGNTPRVAYAGTQVALPGPATLALEPGHDGIRATWAGRHEAWLEVAADAPSDIAREANGAMMLSVRMQVHAAPGATVTMGVGTARLDVTSRLAPGEMTLAFPLSCFKAQDLAKTPTVLRLATAGALDITLEDVRLIETLPGAACPDQR
jgi:beta-glucosidase